MFGAEIFHIEKYYLFLKPIVDMLGGSIEDLHVKVKGPFLMREIAKLHLWSAMRVFMVNFSPVLSAMVQKPFVYWLMTDGGTIPRLQTAPDDQCSEPLNFVGT